MLLRLSLEKMRINNNNIMREKPTRANMQASWSGAVLLVVVAILLGIYFLRINSGYDLVPYNIDPNLIVFQTKVVKAAGDTDKITEYLDNDHNFKTKYLESWSKESKILGENENEIFSVIFSNIEKSVSISVMNVTMEGTIKNSINIDKETNIKVNNQTAVRIDGGSSKDGSNISMILVKNDDLLYVLQGTGQEFEDIVSYFEIY